MRASRRNKIVYAARVWREGQPDLTIRGDLATVRKRATRKLRQHLARQIDLLERCCRAGLQDPLAIVLALENCRVEQDPWGGAVRYKGRVMDNGWGASYHVVVD